MSKWTVKTLVEKFTEMLIRDIQRVKNGHLSFKIHFRNGVAMKVEVDSHEGISGNKYD